MKILSAPEAPGHYFDVRTPLLDAGSLSALPQFDVSLRETQLSFRSGAGVFSRGELDEGSRLLLETIDLPISGRVGDLGCGWGPMAAFVAKLSPQTEVFACDLNPRAVQLANENFRLNHLLNVSAWCGNGFSAVSPASLDCIITNPPVRAGNAVLEELFQGIAQSVKAGGDIWIVLRTAQGAKSWKKKFENLYGKCETIAISGGFRILHSTMVSNSTPS